MPELVCSADSPDWLLHRRAGVTATDITAITGLSPYESAYSLYFKKRGDIPDEHEDTPRLRLGRDLEPIITERWEEDHPALISCTAGLFRSSARPWQMATPDRLVVTDVRGESPASMGVLEVKSWADMDRDSWADGPPARVRAQVLWQMDTLDVAVGHVGVLFLPSGEFRSYVLSHPCKTPEDSIGCEFCKDIALLRAAGRDFMDRLDLNDPPSPDASSATLAALKARFADPMPGKEAEIDTELYERWIKAKEMVDRMEDTAKLHEAKIREQAGEAKHLTIGGVKVATRVIGDQQVKAHERHVDYIRRVASKGDTDA